MCVLCSKYKVSPKELLLSVSIGTFLTNYDVTKRKLLYILTYSTVQKRTEMREKYSNGDYIFTIKVLCNKMATFTLDWMFDTKSLLRDIAYSVKTLIRNQKKSL